MYNQTLVDLLEISYGKGFLSVGGNKSVDEMFYGTDLRGKKLLDIGCGIGGVEFYLAQKFNCEILGIDVEPLVIERANKALEGLQLKGDVKFVCCKDLKQLSENEFDIIFSKEVLLHIKDKESIFRSIYALLKEGGAFIAVDWMHKTSNYSELFATFLKCDGLDINLTDPISYQRMLRHVGFKNVCHEDISERELEETIAILEKTKGNLSREIIDKFGEEYLNQYWIPSLEMQISCIKNGDLLISKVFAIK